MHRANMRGIDAGVLVMDYDGWNKRLNWSYNQHGIASSMKFIISKMTKTNTRFFLGLRGIYGQMPTRRIGTSLEE